MLGGYFTLIMIVSVPEPIDSAQLADRVRQAAAVGSVFQVMARAAILPINRPSKEDTDRFVITAFGTDQPGIVRGSANTWPAKTSISWTSTATAAATTSC